MTVQATLQFDIGSYWHIGSGDEGGAYADALVLKDAQGLPYVPGRSIKGLLREAMTLACENQWFEFSALSTLFGSEGEGQSTQGHIALSSAQLSDNERTFFAQHIDAKAHLYRVMHATAINELGSAEQGSLRSMEVTVPLRLFAAVSVSSLDELEQLKHILPLITHLGAKRHRGFGEVSVSLLDQELS